MRFLIIAILSIMSILIGYSFKSRLHKRVKQLEDIILIIDKIKTQLIYKNISVEEILQILCKENKVTFNFAENILKEYKNLPFNQLWKKEVLQYKCKLSLNNEEICLLSDFGSNFGTTDLDGQIGICEMYKRIFEDCLKNAKEIENKYSQTYSKLGYIGAAIIITLLI